MGTVAILGAGELGGAIAHALAAHERARRVLLIDETGNSAEGKALDIRQTGAIEGFHTIVNGSSDLTRSAGCDVCVVADRFAANAAEWNGEEALALIRNVAAIVGAAPFVFAGHSQWQLLETVGRETAIAPSRLLGSAPEAMRSAIVAIVAMEARCSPGEVQLAVIGVPPSGFVIPWGEVSVGGYAIERVLSQVQLSAIQARSARLWPPGPYALGEAAARVVGAMLDSSRRAFSVMTPLRGEFGVRQRAAALPCRLGARGVEHIRVPSLSLRERVQLETALGV